ncbi:MAG: Cof-type HAD-IIB family hydrolase [Traorella sp.]
MIKLLVTDLDGTFLLPQAINGSYVSDENRKMLEKFRNQGGIFVTCSGRHHAYSFELMKDLGFDFDIIGNNGATLLHNEALIEHNNPARHIVRKVVEELTKEKYHDSLEIMAMDLLGNPILGNPHSWVAERMISHGHTICEKSLLEYLNDRTCYDVTSLHVNIKDPNKLHEWIDYLRNLFDQYFDIYASGPINIEFMRPGINKGHGVRSMMEIYGLKEHEVAVCGDNQNDISMFFAAKYSYCMSTAAPQVQKYAYKVVDSVAMAIEDILKRNEAERLSKEISTL